MDGILWLILGIAVVAGAAKALLNYLFWRDVGTAFLDEWEERRRRF